MLKDIDAGKWAPSFGGHPGPGIDYTAGAIKELQDELGFEVDKTQLTLWEIFKSDFHKEFIGVFTYRWEGDITSLKLEKEEVEKVKWYSLEVLSKILLHEQSSQWAIIGFEKALLEYIKNLP